MLTIKNLTYRVGGRSLFENSSFNLSRGQRVGLVGPNGTGKSTLFKLITGELAPDGGEITITRGTSVGVVRQDLPADETTLIDVVLGCDTERSQLLKELETAEDADRISDICTRLEAINAYDAPSRAATILAGLGFDEAAQQRPIGSFSGGWRMRVALAGALFCQPNLLLLDEPTNHLDIEAIIWLEQYLARYRETLIIISHDRDILNKTTDIILNLDQQKLVSYTGNYDQFERRRAEKLLNQQALHDKQQAQKAHMMAFVERFRAKASKARQAQSRLKAIEKMDLVDAVIADRATSFSFPAPDPLASPLVTLDGVDVGYQPSQPILKNLNLRLDMDDRIALLGANGNGKSTLIKLLSGHLKPEKGEMHQSGKMRVAYFAQQQTDDLDINQTPFTTLRDAMQGAAEPKVRAILGQFGFDKHKADTKIGDLSGGEKSRLIFCLMSLKSPHLMLLDEPTNHLDMDAREALMQALNNYQGAVILVSHDPHLIERVADRLWLVSDGTCTPYEDDLAAYRQLVIQQRRKERSPRANQPKEKPINIKEKLASIEAAITQKTQQRQTIEAQLAEGYTSKKQQQLPKLTKQHQQLVAELEKLELEALELMEQL